MFGLWMVAFSLVQIVGSDTSYYCHPYLRDCRLQRFLAPIYKGRLLVINEDFVRTARTNGVK